MITSKIKFSVNKVSNGYCIMYYEMFEILVTLLTLCNCNNSSLACDWIRLDTCIYVTLINM